jgi:hypothetical protein
MHLNLHANATTTPKTRAYIQASTASAAELAGVPLKTIYRWRGRTSTQDRSHQPHRLATSLSPLEEALVIELRKLLALPLDDITEAMRRCVNPKVSRSATASAECPNPTSPSPAASRRQRWGSSTLT